MSEVENLKKELKILQEKRQTESQIKRLKKEIKGEQFAQTKTGKIFNKIANVGGVGLKATSKFLSAPPQQVSQPSQKQVIRIKQEIKKKRKPKKKYKYITKTISLPQKKPKVISVEDVIARLPQ